MQNKQVKQMIASATHGEWVNHSRCRSNKPSRWFAGLRVMPIDIISVYDRYHSTVSLTAEQMEK